MLITCTNKGCLKSSSAQLNTETMEVMCLECGKSISGISEAMRRTLKSFGQILRNTERKAFMMACRKCLANREVVLDEKNNTVCKVCSEPIKVHAAMKQAIISVGNKLASASEEQEDVEEKPAPKKTKKIKESKV